MKIEEATLTLNSYELEGISMAIYKYIFGDAQGKGGRLKQYCGLRKIRSREELLESFTPKPRSPVFAALIELHIRLDKTQNTSDIHCLYEGFINELPDELFNLSYDVEVVKIDKEGAE